MTKNNKNKNKNGMNYKMKHTKQVVCPYCNQTRSLGKDLTEEIDGDCKILICEPCGYEVYREKVTVKKFKRDKKNG